jgi:hypothetical protein
LRFTCRDNWIGFGPFGGCFCRAIPNAVVMVG